VAPVTGFDTVHRQPRKGLNDHDTTNKKRGLSWPPVGTYMATSGDLNWPPVGTFSWPRTFRQIALKSSKARRSARLRTQGLTDGPLDSA